MPTPTAPQRSCPMFAIARRSLLIITSSLRWGYVPLKSIIVFLKVILVAICMYVRHAASSIVSSLLIIYIHWYTPSICEVWNNNQWLIHNYASYWYMIYLYTSTTWRCMFGPTSKQRTAPQRAQDVVRGERTRRARRARVQPSELSANRILPSVNSTVPHQLLEALFSSKIFCKM